MLVEFKIKLRNLILSENLNKETKEKYLRNIIKEIDNYRVKDRNNAIDRLRGENQLINEELSECKKHVDFLEEKGRKHLKVYLISAVSIAVFLAIKILTQ